MPFVFTFHLRPQLPIQHPIVDRLVQVRRLDRLAAGKVGYGPRGPQDFVVRSGGQSQLGHRRPKHVSPLVVQSAKLASLAMRHVGVVAGVSALKPGGLHGSGGDHQLANLRAGRARRSAGKLLKRHRRHFNVDVDAVHKRPADLAHVSLDLRRRAMAISPRVAPISARARIQRGD
jgi:hypothetical protein